jgi:hypothetical protein
MRRLKLFSSNISDIRWLIRVNQCGVYVGIGQQLYVSRGTICGHRFKRCLSELYSTIDCFTHITVQCVNDKHRGYKLMIVEYIFYFRCCIYGSK